MIRLFLLFGDWGILILRIVVGFILINHGIPKLKDLKKTAGGFSKMGFRPAMFWGTLVAIVETLGGLAIMTGFLTQAVALLVVIEFTVIILKLRIIPKNKTNLEFELIILASTLALAVLGGGTYSLDNLLRLVIY